MTTMTDDINARLAAVEADIRNINTQLVEINANQRRMQAEHQSDIRQLNDRIDQLNDRIDRVFYAVIGFGAGIILTLIGGFTGLIIRLG